MSNTEPTTRRRPGPLGNPYFVGLLAAIVVGVAAAVITSLLDEHAPRILIGVFFGVLAFLAGAAGRARMGSGVTPDETTPTRWI